MQHLEKVLEQVHFPNKVKMQKTSKIGFTWKIVVAMAIFKLKFHIVYPRTRSQAPLFRSEVSSQTPEQKSIFGSDSGLLSVDFSAFLRGQGHAQNTDFGKY